MNTEQKIDSILDKVNEQNTQLVKFIVHQQQQRKEIDVHSTKIEKLTGLKDRVLGIVLFISGSISIAGIIIGLLIKH